MRQIKQRGFMLILGFVFTIQAFAAPETEFREYAVSNLNEATMLQVADEFEVLRRDGSRFIVLVPTTKTSTFLKLAPQAELVPEEAQLDAEALSGYRDFEAVEATLKKIAAEHPDIVHLETYGQSTAGRPLYALKLSDNAAMDEADEPRLLLDAATHGDEIITTEVLVRLLEELVNGYGSDNRLTDIVNKNAIYFVPVVNPDGFVQRARYADGVDPNRQYPYPDKPDQQPIGIIKSIMDLFAKHQFQGAVTLHAYGEMVMYPWGYTHDSITDEANRADFAGLTKKMAEENNYVAGPISKVIYVAKGSSSDYYYWKHQTKAIAVEIGHSKAPSSDKIPGILDDVREMTWRFLEHFTPQ